MFKIFLLTCSKNEINFSQTPKSNKQDIDAHNLSFTLHVPPHSLVFCTSPMVIFLLSTNVISSNSIIHLNQKQ